MTVRTRFAPSPTGYIHVGNVRAALFPWLLARQQQGTYILRIEDTDQARFVDGATDLILDTLEWLGIDWDEGPRKGGEFGPYIQSERRDIYKAWAQKLVDKGLAYADPYTPEEVQTFREEAKALKKPFLYRDHRPENPPAWDGTQPLRLKVTDIKRYTWNDPVMGELSAGPEVLDDFILMKADGLPTYNFAHIVDDAEMNVTHVIRGLEYISSIPRYLSLYEALGLEVPVLACLPHIMAPDGKKKLGKRDGAKSVQEYRTDGILPEAMLNFLASMGWNDGTEQELFSREELIEKFSLDRVQRSGARFDEQRLLWMNGQWIRRLSLDDLYTRTLKYWPKSAETYDEAYKKQVLGLVQDRLKTLAELPMMTKYFFEEPVINTELITDNKQLKKLSPEEVSTLLTTVKTEFENLSEWTPEALQECLNRLLDVTGQKPGILFSLVRIVTTWAPFSPQLNDTLALLGKDKTLERMANYTTTR
ncbi:glutamate--tRNA ligase [Candidatus Saccharibacteria bacterium 32-49-10]|nr:MAG: glutamate--tRNA ligase [Candidatus Saccharibacteria bacterium 32-49-10]